MNKDFEPRIFSAFRKGYTRKELSKDIIAGTIVGIISLPLAIAFAIASGVKPEQGLYTAIVAGFVASMLAGSRHQISGPTGAFIVIIFGIVQKYGYDGLVIATMLAGVILIIMGLLRFGSLMKYIPYTLVIGFTSGIAVIIFISQIKDFLGISQGILPAEFIDKLIFYWQNINNINIFSVIIALMTILIMVLLPKITHKIPASFVAIILLTIISQYFNLPLETIGSKFGEVPNSLPMPHLPVFSWDVFIKVFSPALTIAMLAGIESLLSAVVADGMTGKRHRSNMELIAQGSANLISPIFLGIPATGALARTATNIRSGAVSPVSGITHALVIFLIMIFFGKMASLIPLSIFAGILIVVAYNMSQWQSFLKIFKGSKSDLFVMLITFVLTIFIDLTVAIEVGVISSALLFIKRISDVSESKVLNRDLIQNRESEERNINVDLQKDIIVFEVYGTLFFGAVEKFTQSIKIIDNKIKCFILETSNLLVIDASGLNALEQLINRLKKQNSAFIISGIHKQPLFSLHQSGLIDQIGDENLCVNLDEAIELAKSKILKSKAD